MSKNTVNEFVRRKVRELRKSRKMKIREIATLTGMPYSSYASLESGFYNINLALLHNSGRVTDRSQSCLNAIEFALTQACPDLAYDSAPHI